MVLIGINGANAAVRSQDILTVGMVGAEAKFSFSGDMWDGLGKVAVFRQGNVTKDAILANDAAVIPWEVLQLPGIPVSIGVYGAREDGSVVVPTVWAKTNPVQPAADPSGDESYLPTPSAGEQAVRMAEEAIQAARELQASLDAAAGSATTAENHAKAAASSKTAAATSAQQAANSAGNAERSAQNAAAAADNAARALLEEAKQSGEFDGPPGYTPVKGKDYFDGYTPVKGKDYFDGDDYVLTDEDKTEIATKTMNDTPLAKDVAKLTAACGVLPAEYTPLEYIESSGTQLIRTGVYGYADGSYVRGHRWEFDVEFTNNGTRQLMGYGAEGREYWGVTDAGYYESGGKPLSTLANSRNIVVHDYSGGTAGGNYLRVENETLVSVDYNVLTTSEEYTLFGLGSRFYTYSKLYRCKCFKGTTLIRDYVPCKNASGEVGLYDLVNSKFYGNAGTGEFTGKGLPSGYTRLEYIESTGTEWIDTGVSAPNGFRFVGKINLTTSSTELQGIIGSHDATSPYYRNFFAVQLPAWGFGSHDFKVFGTSVQPNTDYELDVSTASNNLYARANGVTQSLDGFTPTSATRSANSLYLLAVNDGTKASVPISAKLGACQIYTDGTLVRNFIPCRNENGAVGLYDLVNGVFYGNAGTGEFLGNVPTSTVYHKGNKPTLADICPDGAGAHNAIYRGVFLGAAVTAAQWAAIKAGTFTGLFIGDYWTIGGVNYRIAAFDYYYRTGDTDCTTHHVTLVPDGTMYNHRMNDTDITTGAYVGSKMYTDGLTQAKTTINSVFGEAHILNHRQYLKNAVTDGYESAGTWYDSTVELMTEQNVYGCKIFGNGLNGTAIASNGTVDKSQYPLFAFRPDMISNRIWFWLRDVFSASKFTAVDGYGIAGSGNASAAIGVRPAFSIC